MPQTFYVAQDEEILSVVGRLRSSALLENVFVVPKHALILQGIVNLRILSREAQKLGKAVFIVTQDDEGRALAEKAGIMTKQYSEDTRNIGVGAVARERSPGIIPARKEPTSIGSDDFFSGVPQETSAPIETSDPEVRNLSFQEDGDMRLRVRNASPQHLTALNSAVHAESAASEQESLLGGNEHIRSAAENPKMPDRPKPAIPSARPTSPAPSVGPGMQQLPKSKTQTEGKNERLARMFQPTPRREPSVPSRRREPTDEVPGKGGSFWFFLFAGISLVSLVGVGGILFLPKAEVIVTPQSASENIEMEFTGKTDGGNGDREIPLRLIERTEEISLSIETTGTTEGNGEKARGTVVISNNYSTESQPLVATTRLETEDGKIFRLVKGVTVPGITEISGNREPGAIEAEVIADQSGKDYNVGPSTFTVPGFKGGPKYAGFSAKSTSAMVGGGAENDDAVSAVAQSDIDRALDEAKEKFRTTLEAVVRESLSSGESFLMETADIALSGTPAAPTVGMVSPSFEYKATFRGRVFVFPEDELERKVADILRKKSGVSDSYETRDISIEYGDGAPDYDSGTFYLKFRVSAMFVAKIDEEKIREDLLGKGGDEIREMLAKYPGVKKVEVNLRPKYFNFSVPKNPERVTIVIEKP